MGQGSGKETADDDDPCGYKKEEAAVRSSAEVGECGAGDGSNAPADVEESQTACAMTGGGSSNDISGGEAGGDSKASDEERKVSGREAGPGE